MADRDKEVAALSFQINILTEQVAALSAYISMMLSADVVDLEKAKVRALNMIPDIQLPKTDTKAEKGYHSFGSINRIHKLASEWKIIK